MLTAARALSLVFAAAGLGVLPGSHAVGAQGVCGTPNVSVSPSSVPAGRYPVLSVTWYAPSSPVSLTVYGPDGSPVQGPATISVDASCHLAIPIPIWPTHPAGWYTVVANSESSRPSLQTGFTVTSPAAATPAQPTPCGYPAPASVTPSTVALGGSVLFVASNFTPSGEVSISLSYPTSHYPWNTTAIADANCRIHVTIPTLPTHSTGTYTITALGAGSDGLGHLRQEASFTVTGAAPPPPTGVPAARGVTVTVDRGEGATYYLDDPITVCVTVYPGWSRTPVIVTDMQPGWTSRVVYQGYVERQWCDHGVITPPLGTETITASIVNDLSFPDVIYASAQVTFRVLDRRAQPASPTPQPTPTLGPPPTVRPVAVVPPTEPPPDQLAAQPLIPRPLRVAVEGSRDGLLRGQVESADPGQALVRVATDWYVTLQVFPAMNRATIHPSDSVHAAIGFLGPGAEARWSATFAGEGAALEVCAEVTQEAMLFHLLQLLRDAAAGAPSASVLLDFAGLATHVDQVERTTRATVLLSEMPRLASALAATRDPVRFATELAASWDEERDQWDVLGPQLIGDAWGEIRNTEVPPDLFEAVPQAADMMAVLLFQGGRDCLRFVVQ